MTPDGAAGDYAVVVVASDHDPGAYAVDRPATEELRRTRLATRLGGSEPTPRLAQPAPGRRIGHCLVVADGQMACRLCGQDLGPAERNVKESLVMAEVPTWERWALSQEYEGATRFVLRRFYCPGCAVQMFVEVNLKDAPPVWSIEVFA